MPRTNGSARHLAYYVTSHGFGHATRTCAILRELFLIHERRARAKLHLHIVGDVPRWIFDDLAPWDRFIRFRPKRCDFGLAQKDGIHVDHAATEAILATYLDGFDAVAREEAEFMREREISIVASDIPALPFLAASIAGIPSVGISNFGWDFIYRAYAGESAIFAEAIARFEDAYGRASLLLRLPFSPPMEIFPRRDDIPLVVRHARRSREAVRAELRLATDPRPIALLSFGGFGLKGLSAEALAEHDDVVFLVFGIDASAAPPNVLAIPDGRYFFPDLVRAADVIISKPGYSIVSEAIAHQRPMLYAPRDDFPEAAYLVAGLEAHVPAERIELDALSSGGLGAALDRLLASKEYRPLDRTDGAVVAAERILRG